MKTIFNVARMAFLVSLSACGPAALQPGRHPSAPGYSPGAYSRPTPGSSSNSSGFNNRASSYDFGGTQPVPYPSQRSGVRSGSIYSNDYTVDQTLGGNTRVSDRWGNSSTFDRTLSGDLRSSTNTGRVTTYSQTLGGGYKATDSNNTTYQREQNLGGGYRVTGSDGSRYQRTQTLGGGYRYDPY